MLRDDRFFQDQEFTVKDPERREPDDHDETQDQKYPGRGKPVDDALDVLDFFAPETLVKIPRHQKDQPLSESVIDRVKKARPDRHAPQP